MSPVDVRPLPALLYIVLESPLVSAGCRHQSHPPVRGHTSFPLPGFPAVSFSAVSWCSVRKPSPSLGKRTPRRPWGTRCVTPGADTSVSLSVAAQRHPRCFQPSNIITERKRPGAEGDNRGHWGQLQGTAVWFCTERWGGWVTGGSVFSPRDSPLCRVHSTGHERRPRFPAPLPTLVIYRFSLLLLLLLLNYYYYYYCHLSGYKVVVQCIFFLLW